ncbi:bifunctional hydroxymethylpyrimidine kinase/phosphomethylpyrimidine kinase [Halorubrum lipolyticum]|uniref:Phosphomethylpyrimidine kinase n=1 Tax=Halorubrum lipolyticum DSM 21995 TaxID=1227482 RepID=M0NS44_9EURY|nr:bifunctional hydroxymethylpyrimidine kinase/phosphomethylpyrimidine kinase [Halorubrum lipolyticum]EMA60792.1 phosphomethylpyrimidine kinase [Halorubrum lipolyticum DSM 21995]
MTPAREPVSPPVALSIAGSDSGGGAGIQADLKAMTAHGVFGTSVVTATTAQNTRGVRDVHAVPSGHVASQCDAVFDDFDVSAVKTGMLATAETVETVTGLVAAVEAPIVVDPVMVAASGDRLLSPEAETAYEGLIEAATLVTPNADEAEVLVDAPVEAPADAERAGRELVAVGADAALIKGGHLGDGERVTDTLVVGGEEGEATALRFENPRVATEATHGSGCALSSAVAARLARGEPLREAVAAAVDGMGPAIRRGYDVGEGPGAVNPTAFDGGA